MSMKYWTNVHREESTFYTTWRCKPDDGMAALREFFPDGKADEMNFVLFSTSGVHGSYRTIEEEELEPGGGVTFVIVNPRKITLWYGNVFPQTPDDFAFLKALRASSIEATTKIGVPQEKS